MDRNVTRNFTSFIYGSKKWIYVIIFVIMASIFSVFLPFLDLFNLKIFLYANSYFYLSQSPYNIFPYPAPPNFVFPILPFTIVYIWTGFDIFISVLFSKVEIIVFFLMTSFVFSQIILQITHSTSKSNLYFAIFLFSPVFFFVNFVEWEFDIFPIFFSLLALNIYLSSPLKKSCFYLPTFGLLVFASFMYYFPAIIIVVLLMYSQTKREFVYKLISVLFFTAIYFLSFFFLNIWVPTNPIEAINPSGPSIVSTWYILATFGFNLSQTYIVFVTVAVIVVVTCIYLRHIGANLFLAITVSFTILFLTVEIYNLDEFIWLLPFFMITLASLEITHREKLLAILIQLYLLPVIFVMNIWEGRFGMGTGVFYFSYNFLGKNIPINGVIPFPVQFTVIADTIIFALLITIVTWFVLKSKFRNIGSPTGNKISGLDNAQLSSGDKTSITFKSFFRSFKRISTVIVIIVVLLILILPLPSGIHDQNPNFPFGIMIPIPVADNPSISYAYSQNYSTVTFSPTNSSYNTPVIFERNMSQESLLMNFSVLSGGARGLSLSKVFNFSSLSIDTFSYYNISADDQLPMNFEKNTSDANDSSFFMWDNIDLPTYKTYGNSIISFNSSIQNGENFLFFFKPIDLSFPQNIVFRLRVYGTNTTIDLTQNDLSEFSFSESISFGVWTTKYFVLPHVYQWYAADIEFANSTISLSLNGNSPLSFNYTGNNAKFLLYLGKFGTHSYYNDNNSYSGYFSPVYQSMRVNNIADGFEMENSSVKRFYNTSSLINIIVKTLNEYNVIMTYKGKSFWSTISANKILEIGRINFSSQTITARINSIQIESYVSFNLIKIILILTYVLPFAITIAWIDSLNVCRRKYLDKGSDK